MTTNAPTRQPIRSPRDTVARKGSAFLATHPRARLAFLLTAPLFWLVVVYIVALALLLVTAFWSVDSFTGEITTEFTLDNIIEVVTGSLYQVVTLRTLGVALLVTLIDVLLALPIAFFMGDLNSYDKEDPIDTFRAAGYTDLVREFQGEEAYSYVFDGQLGYLDYALGGTSIVDRVTGAEPWHINSDEPSLIDYDMTFKKPAQDALFAPDEWRSSDHDPVVVGLDLDVVAPELAVTASTDVVFPPNAKWRSITFDVAATDNVDADVTAEIVGVQATGHKAEIRKVSDTEVEVLARQGATYAVTFQATDDSGNATTQTVTIRVAP